MSEMTHATARALAARIDKQVPHVIASLVTEKCVGMDSGFAVKLFAVGSESARSIPRITVTTFDEAVDFGARATAVVMAEINTRLGI